MKLFIELVPSSCWGKNLRNKISREEWNKIRKQVYKNYNYKCGICKRKRTLSNSILHSHEIWKYYDKERLQVLKGFIALCYNCHAIKHIGLSLQKADEGKLDFNKLVDHFNKVNNSNDKDFDKHLKEELKRFKKRSKHNWKLVIKTKYYNKKTK